MSVATKSLACHCMLYLPFPHVVWQVGQTILVFVLSGLSFHFWSCGSFLVFLGLGTKCTDTQAGIKCNGGLNVSQWTALLITRQSKKCTEFMTKKKNKKKSLTNLTGHVCHVFGCRSNCRVGSLMFSFNISICMSESFWFFCLCTQQVKKVLHALARPPRSVRLPAQRCWGEARLWHCLQAFVASPLNL